VIFTLVAWVCLATALAAWTLAWEACEVEIPAASAGAHVSAIAAAVAVAV
jgi:hypothetical protein